MYVPQNNYLHSGTMYVAKENSKEQENVVEAAGAC